MRQVYREEELGECGSNLETQVSGDFSVLETVLAPHTSAFCSHDLGWAFEFS